MRKTIKLLLVFSIICSLCVPFCPVFAEDDTITLTGSNATVELIDGTSYDISDAGSATGGTALASQGVTEFYDYRIKIDTKAAGADEEEQTAIADAIEEILFDVNIEIAGWYVLEPNMSIYKTSGGEINWLSKVKIGVNGEYTDELTEQDFDIVTAFNAATYCTVGKLKKMVYLNEGNNEISFKPSVRAQDGYNKWFRINNLKIIPKEYKKLGEASLTLTGIEDAFVTKSDKTEIYSGEELSEYSITETSSYINVMSSTETEEHPVLIGVRFNVTEQNGYTLSASMMADILGTRAWHSAVSYAIDNGEAVRLSESNTTVVADNGATEPFISDIKLKDKIWLTEGVHTLWFIPEEATLSTPVLNFRLKSVTLTPIKSIEGLSATLSKTILNLGETSPAIVVSNGKDEVITNEDVTQITYASDNNYVATIYGDGTIKARNMGSANISVCVESVDSNGVSKNNSCEIPVYVVGDSGLYIKESVITNTGVRVKIGSTKGYTLGETVIATVHTMENGMRTSITDMGTGVIGNIAENGDISIDVPLSKPLPEDYVISIFLCKNETLETLYGKTVVSE